MAPPKRATPRRVGSQEPRQVASPSPLAALGLAASDAPENPDGSTSSLPQVRTRQSFSYGTTKTPPMPAPLEKNPDMNPLDILESIDAGLKQANKREQELAKTRHQVQVSGEGQIRTRAQTRRSQSIDPLPGFPQTRSRRRQMTPDDQLMDSLRESSEDSRSPSENSVSDSVISWRIERDIHGSQEMNGREVEQPRGMTTLAAKPRRPTKASGLRDIIKEEPEEAEELHISSVPASEEVSTNNTEARATHETTTVGRSPVENISADVSPSVESATSVAESVSHSTANTSDTSPTIPIAPILIRNFNSSPLSILTFLLAIIAMFGTYTFSDKLIEIPHTLSSFPIFGGINKPHVEYNVSDLAGHASAINHLSSQFDKLGERFRDMSKEINDIRDDWSKKLPLINEVISRTQPPPSEQARDPLSPPRVNFCSFGLGAVADPFLSTPAATENLNFFHRLYLSAILTRQAPSHGFALQPWEGVGDCYCGSRGAEITQLVVLLGEKIVPDEVVIEHISKEATLEPGAAPRDMELWVKYNVDSSVDTESISPFPLHDTIMGTLREAYPGEPESVYSDDILLGPDYYRVGKWMYDIHADNPIQAFPLSAVIDMPNARVEKVAFRATTNWGSDHTCFYRVRLHGYL